ncbi:MAG: cation-transporting P-type ATPase [Leptolyngbyaceae cyanobacterium]
MADDCLPFHRLAIQDLVQQLNGDLEKGMTSEAIAQRYETEGWNELPIKSGQPAWLKFLLQFNQPLLYILLIAGAVKAFLGSWTNAAVIWGVTVLNAVIGYVQEAKAEGAIAALAKAVTTETTVIREGQTLQIPSRDLVVGDLVLLASGDKVPADLRLFKTRNLQVDESALTGESLPVEKTVEPLPSDTALAERTNMAYAGSFVTFGQGRGLVVATAAATEVGQISQAMDERVNLSTPLTRKFAKFSRSLLYGILTLATLTFAIGLGQGESWLYMFEATVALAVSAIPEGLPAVVTITLAIGVNRMAQRHAIIRKLPAVEALGSATVICSDKTGTLTENQMTVQAIMAGGESYQVSGGGYSTAGEMTRLGDSDALSLNALPDALSACLKIGVLCNDAQLHHQGHYWSVVGDPTEGALLVAAAKADLTQPGLATAYPRLDSIPFESQYQYMATLNGTESRRIYVKGSVEALLSRCTAMVDAQGQSVPLEKGAIEQAVETMTAQALRVLALAQKEVPQHQHVIDHSDIETGLVFVGLQGMIDPPRPEAISAVHACQSAGIDIKMITGDHISTARAIAQRMGIYQEGTQTAIINSSKSGYGTPPILPLALAKRRVSAGGAGGGGVTQPTVQAFEGQALTQMDDTQLAQAAASGTVFARVAPAQKLRLVEALQTKGHIVAMTGDGVNDAPALKQADIGIAMGKNGTEVAREAADMLLTDDNFASIEAAVEEGRTVYQNLRKAIAFLLPVNGGESMTILISALLARDLPILSLQVLWLNMINSLTMTIPLAFEPKSEGTMRQQPRNPQEPLITKRLLRRILLVSLFNWILIFGIFEWAKAATGDVAVARTMAIQALVAARIIYLLSISQLGISLIDYLRRKSVTISNAPFLLAGIVGAVALQVVFSQWPLMNTLFETAPLTWGQGLVCLLPMVPMVPYALWVNTLDSPNCTARNSR